MTEEGPPVMSDAEREVLKVLWDHGPLAVRDVAVAARRGRSGVGAVDGDHALAAAREERLCRQRQEQVRVRLSRAVLSREDVMRARMNDLAGELCDGDALPLVLAFAERHRFSPSELARFRQMIDDLEAKRGKRGPK